MIFSERFRESAGLVNKKTDFRYFRAYKISPSYARPSYKIATRVHRQWLVLLKEIPRDES